MAAYPARRRAVLAMAAALPLAAMSGCSGLDVLGTPPAPPHDVELLQGAIAAEQLMVSRYREVLSAPSSASLAPSLRALLAEHEAHLTQLQARLILPAGSAASKSAAASPAPQATQAPPALADALAFLKTAEQAAAAAMTGRLPGAPASLAQLFASISASEATHVPVLTIAGAAAMNLPGTAAGRGPGPAAR